MKHIILAITICLSILIPISKVSAYDFSGIDRQPPVTQYYFNSGANTNSDPVTAINSIYGRISNTAYSALSAMAVIYLIYSGIMYLTSGGSPDKVKKARQMMINVILGIVFLLATYSILSIVWSIVNYFTSP